VRGFEAGHGVGQVGTGCDANATDLGGQGIGDVVTIQVECRHHRVLGRAQQDLLQEGIGDAVLDDDVLAGLRVLELAPRAAVDQLGAKLSLGQRVRPVAEAADLIISSIEKSIASKKVTYDFARLMDGATQVSCSGFGQVMIDNM
jgi:hypothetical protein